MVKNPVSQTRNLRIRHQDRETAMRTEIHTLLRNGDFDIIKSIMQKYPEDEINRFLERNISLFFTPCILAPNIEAINFLLANVPKNLVLSVIEKNNYEKLRNFITAVYPSSGRQGVREIRKRILIKLAKLDEDLSLVIYTTGYSIFNDN